MSKPEQVLIIQPPNELTFTGPFKVPVKTNMKLTNPSEKEVLFKIKTTAPKKYCVRPNSGAIKPGEVINIAITLQPMENGTNDKNLKHKFMVQSVFFPENGEYDQFDQYFKDTPSEQIMDSKLKCVFGMPEEAKSKEKTAEASPKATNEAPVNPYQLETIKAELNELREAEKQLRQENFQLKEQILIAKPDNMDANPVSNKYSPPVSQEYMAVLIIVGVVLGILGMILGKFVL